MPKNEIVKTVAARDLAAETSVFAAYLEQSGLPTDNVIASTDERAIIGQNLPTFLGSLSADTKKDARYLSKFVGASSVGLFDAALNYVWNEVILTLRRKASVYGVDLFFDAAVGGKNRDAYSDESDLAGLKDSVLLDTCLKLELISDVVYRKLDHILTMRNEVAASHPNVESIGAYELMGWLQTCVKDVLQDQPSESAIRIKSLVDGLREAESVVDDDFCKRFRRELKYLSPPHVDNLLVTFFGLYVAPRTEQVLRKNVSLLSPIVWGFASDRVKYSIGVKIDGYVNNLQQKKAERGRQFFQTVGGRAYESLPSKLVALEVLAGQLRDAHGASDNFYNEPPLMEEILSYCRGAGVPAEAAPTLVRVVLQCRIGRGLSYRDGVSPGGRPLYDEFFGLLDDDGIAECLVQLASSELSSKLSNPICQEHLKAVLDILAEVAIGDRLKMAIDFLRSDVTKAHRAHTSKKYRELTSSFISWT